MTARGTWATLLFTVGVIAAAEVFVTVEWSFPYCNDPYDGPASAVFGILMATHLFSLSAIRFC